MKKRHGNEKEDRLMKTRVLLLFCALMALAACSNDENNSIVTPPKESKSITFNLTANHPDNTYTTRAVKAGWESGDVIFVFFTGANAPNHLKMTYDGTAWMSAEYNGATMTPGALGLKNGDTGTMRAVYLPFGSTATVSASGDSFTFSKTYYAYYLTATLSYTVSDNKVSGAFNMVIPDGFVQFFVEDAGASDEAYMLGCDAVVPMGVASIAADGAIIETSDKTAADDMMGYSYSGGYLFSGKLTSWSYGNNYYFASHSAVKLPANGDARWQEVGKDVCVNMKVGENDLGIWHTCNYNQSEPESKGEVYSYSEAMSLVTVPSESQITSLFSNCQWTKLSCHGQVGAVLKSDTGFLFIPRTSASDNEDSHYWTSRDPYFVYIVFSNLYWHVLRDYYNSKVYVRALQ